MSHLSPNMVAANLRSRLPKSVFEPARSRLFWLPLHLSVVIGGTWGIAVTSGWPGRFALSLLIGLSFAGLAFVAHEALHGALCRRRRLRRLVGVLGFLPFCLSPRLWIAWHNRVHHGNTNRPGKDPDAMATLQEYRNHRGARWSANVQRYSRGLFTLLFGFSIQSLQVLLTAESRGYLAPRHARRAMLESLAAAVFWGGVLWAVGPLAFLFSYVLPLLIANGIVMAHILTNHGLRPLDADNDPLVSSTTVTVPRWFSFFTLGFGYHTEHHLFPAMSHRHGPLVSEQLQQLYPQRYHKLPLHEALWKVCTRPRVILDERTLIDPRSGETVRQFVGLDAAVHADSGENPESEASVETLRSGSSSRVSAVVLRPPPASLASPSSPPPAI